LLVSVLVRLMGVFSVQVDGRIVVQGDFERRSAAAVVKILALAPHHRMHREQIMDHLWPQLPFA
jgi:DNA-binding SARP family transcriptional activator